MNGDGTRDMLLLDGERLNVFIAGAEGLPEKPTRVEKLPGYLEHDGERAALRSWTWMVTATRTSSGSGARTSTDSRTPSGVST